MELSFRTVDHRELPGFRTYLLPETAEALERREEDRLAVGAVTGRSACAAAAVRLEGREAELTDLFVDASVRGRGAGRLLLEELLRQAEARGAERISADYVLRGGELAAMDRLLTGLGFSAPRRRSRTFLARSEGFHDDPRLGAAFSPRYQTPPGLVSFGAVPSEALEELELAGDIPEHLSWEVLQDRALPDLSVALVQEGRVGAYLLAGESADGGCVLLSAVRREGAPPSAFQSLLIELLDRCWYRFGGDFAFYFSTLTEDVERLALLLMGDRFTDYEEHTCGRMLLPTPKQGEEEEIR